MLRTEGGTALVLLKGSPSCKGCGAGKIGLCSAGKGSMMLSAENSVGAHSGDPVLVGIDERVRWKGYSLAYLLPLFSFVAGSFVGSFAEDHLGVPFLDAAAGFAAFLATSAFTFFRLRKLDSTCRMAIKRVLTDGVFTADLKSDEERRFESYDAVGR